jgi:hypothetical protein
VVTWGGARYIPEYSGVSLRINGEEHSLTIDTRTSLLDLLRVMDAGEAGGKLVVALD